MAKYSGWTITASYLLDLGGNQVTEFNNTGAWVHSNVWAGGKLMATYEGAAGPHPNTYHFHLTDWLGTQRMQTTAAGNNEEVCYSYPFGDGLYCPGAADATEHHFTSKERDAESGLDYFGARYLATDLGRWMSPDPINLTNTRVLNPANTLNKYVYGANNPFLYTDRDGKDITFYYRAPDNIADFGHIFIGVLNQKTGSAAFLDFHPTGNELFSPGSFQNNLKALGASGITGSYASLTIQTSPEVAQELIKVINQIEKSGKAPDYFLLGKLLGSNCTTVLEDVLHDLGLDFGDISPKEYWTDLYDKFSPEVQENPFKAFASAPSAPGIDYGDPRNNLKPSDYAKMMLDGLNSGSGDDGSSVSTTVNNSVQNGETITLNANNP